ncbi:MAG TPA: restriction endonuclease subunit S [Verrucomicrobiae bacterium]|nr:restriction endonuclease subunit S [Verrucomicrobiae bacterium]
MNRWPTKPLGEICDVVAGGTPSRGRPEFFKGKIPWVKIGDMLQGTVSETEETISQLGLENSAAKLLPAGTILISIFATIGRTAVLGVEAATNQAIAGVTPKDTRQLTPPFLRLFLDCSVAELTTRARGGAQLNINGKILKSLLIPIPSLAEQERIVKLLDEADALRKLRAQADRRTAEFIPALFHKMFGAASRWSKPLGEIVTFGNGATPSKGNEEFWSGNIPWISPKDMKVDEIFDGEDHVSQAALEQTNLHLIPKDTVLIVVRGMILAHTVPIRLCRVPVTINQDMKALLPKDGIMPEFLHCALQAQHAHILNQVTTAAHGTKKLDSDKLKAVMIPVPPLPLQKEFAERVKEIRALETAQARSRARLDALFASLLDRAFKGEL